MKSFENESHSKKENVKVFKYEALSKKGKKKSGVVLADSDSVAYKTICKKELIPIDIAKVHRVSSKISLEELLMFFMHVDFQLKCGLKINEAIDTFADSQNNKILNAKLLEVSDSLKNGQSLNEAFKNSIFDSVISGLLNSAEKTGNLSEIIANILAFLKLKNEWKEKAKSALAYPVFITLIAIIILWVCVVFLGPQVISLLNDTNGGEIPILTNFAVNYLPVFGAIFTIIVSVFFSCIICFSALKKFRKKLQNYLLSIPKIGSILKKIVLWNFFKILQIALNSKLDFMKSLELGIDSVEIEDIKNDLEKIRSKILSGHKIFETFSSSKYISQSISTALYVGESGNNLPDSMRHISDELYKEIIRELELFGRSLSIGLTLFTGGIFIFILSSLFLPLYNYIGVIRQ
ncbi:MAG: type II secretion system F family protein [Alphaproteobacteria bacterium]|nr:type II secretion system F family protein [Alphaproteobacteria bacterium]